MCFKLVKNNLRKVAGLFCTFLTIPVGVEKYVELIEKKRWRQTSHAIKFF